MPRSGPILVAMELSTADRRLVDTASTYARGIDAEVCLIHVGPVAEEEFTDDGPSEAGPADPGQASDGGGHQEHHGGDHHHLRRAKAALERQGLDVTALHLAGMPGDRIAAEARRLKASLIVCGHRHRTMFGEIVFGSTSRDVLAAAPCPVLLIPER